MPGDEGIMGGQGQPLCGQFRVRSEFAGAFQRSRRGGVAQSVTVRVRESRQLLGQLGVGADADSARCQTRALSSTGAPPPAPRAPRAAGRAVASSRAVLRSSGCRNSYRAPSRTRTPRSRASSSAAAGSTSSPLRTPCNGRGAVSAAPDQGKEQHSPPGRRGQSHQRLSVEAAQPLTGGQRIGHGRRADPLRVVQPLRHLQQG